MTIPRAARGDQPPPPYWRPLRDGDRISASMTCPAGHFGTLLDHEIAADGTVTPSVQCHGEGCTFHESGVQLLGWGEP